MTIREKIMAHLDKYEDSYDFSNSIRRAALDHAADIAEAEVQRLEARVRELEERYCETCEHWDNSPWQVEPETRLCLFPERRANAESWGVC